MQIFLTKEAQKQFKKLPKSIQPRTKRKLLLLEKNLSAGKKLSGEFKGLYSLRSWPYRIIYKIIRNEIWIISILHRQGAYK